MSPAIVPGKYPGRAVQVSQEITETSTGSEQVSLAVDLDVGGSTQRVWTYLPLSDRALPFTIKRLRACGWTGRDITCMTGLDSNTIEVEAKEDTYNGKTRTKFDIVTPRETKPLEGAARRALAVRVAEIAAETATTDDPPPAPEAAADDLPSDEAPF